MVRLPSNGAMASIVMERRGAVNRAGFGFTSNSSARSRICVQSGFFTLTHVVGSPAVSRVRPFADDALEAFARASSKSATPRPRTCSRYCRRV